MAVNVLITEQKFFDQFKNDITFSSNLTDYTNNLAGSVMEQVKIFRSMSIETKFVSQASIGDGLAGVGEISVGTLQMILNTGKKWKDKGFAPGDTVYITWTDATGAQNNTGTVLSITNNTMLVTWSGYPAGTINGWVNNSTVVYNTMPLEALDYYFGLIDNNETSLDAKSKVSGNDQGYYAAGIGYDTGGGVRDTNFVAMLPLSQSADQGWITGSMQVRFVSADLLNTNPIRQHFEIEHILTINPWYLDGELTNLQNDIIPQDLAGANSYKYAFKTLWKTVLSNPNTEKVFEYTDDLGSVAWFNENFNGYNNLYQINSIDYTEEATGNPADGILIASKTRVTIQVEANSRNFVVGDRVGVYMSYTPDQSEYNTTPLTNMFENFLYDNALGNSGASGINGQFFITNLTTFSPSGNIMTFYFDVEYTSTQKAFLAQRLQNQPTYFILGVQLGDDTLASGNSDKLIILADVELYDESPDIPDLIDFTKFNIYPHDKQIGAGSFFTDYLGWNEDGVVIDATFKLNITQEAVINSLEGKLIAYNDVTEEYFELDSYSFNNIGNAPVSSGIQQLNESTTRGYNLAVGDQFNDVLLSTGALVAGEQFYSLTFAQKISWQDWIQNLNVDNVFFDNSKTNDNKNLRASNYSFLNDYTIRFAMFSNLDGKNVLGVSGNTNYLFISPPITVYDYDLDGNTTPDWVGTIETFHPTTLVNLGGAVLSGTDTLMITTWVPAGAPIVSVTNMWAIHRVEPSFQPGYDIDELSTINPYPVPNKPIPQVLETQLKIDPITGNVVTECLIDGSQISNSTQYNLSARLNENAVPVPDGKITEQGVVKYTETSQTKIVE